MWYNSATPTFNIEALCLVTNVELLKHLVQSWQVLLTHFATKATPIIIDLVSVETLHELTESDYNLFNQSYKVHSCEFPLGDTHARARAHTHTHTHTQVFAKKIGIKLL